MSDTWDRDLPANARWQRICRECHGLFYATEAGRAEHEAANGHRPFRYSLRKRKPVAAAVRRAVYERDAFTCQECGFRDAEWPTRPRAVGPRRRSDGNYLTLDHHTPWALGGSNEPDNLVTLCWDCNQEKAKADRARVDRILDYLREHGHDVLPRFDRTEQAS